MAHTPNPGYIPGDRWTECPRCGFDKRLSELVLEADTQLKVCKECCDTPYPKRPISGGTKRN